MIDTTRRTVLGGGLALPLMAKVAGAATVGQSIEADLRRYIGFGLKRAGSPGDNACGEWLAGELKQAGYVIEHQSISVPFFETSEGRLTSGGKIAEIYAQPIVVPTGKGGVSGPLVRVDEAGRCMGSLDGAIALVDLPYARWSTLLARPIRQPVTAAFDGGAKAVVIITNGPTGKIIALNTDGRKPMFAGPLALIAPEDAGDFLAAAMTREVATLVVDGKGGRRPAFNFVGRIDRGKGRWLAISTPRSGWFACAGERGPGVAVWLELARWASREVTSHNLALICNSGHEYEYLGAEESLRKIAPPVPATRFWLHLGANVAARDWHDAGARSMPLPNADSQRYLSVTPDLLALSRTVFAGQDGFEAPVSSDVLSAGELTGVVEAGYKPAAGVFGVHRYHHVAQDDERCILPDATTRAGAAFRELLLRSVLRAGS